MTPVTCRDHQLPEVPVGHDQIAEATAVDVATLTGERQQGRIDQQFLLTVGLACRGIDQPRPFAQDNVLAAAESHVADLRTDGEDLVGYRVVRHHSGMMPSAAVPCDAWCDRVIAYPNCALLGPSRVPASSARASATRNGSRAQIYAEQGSSPASSRYTRLFMVLHRREPGPAGRRGDALRLGELPRIHAGHTYVAHFAGLHHLVQGPHGLLDRCLVVQPVELVQVDVVGARRSRRRRCWP